MKIDAEMILEKHCPSMSNLYLDAQGRNFRDRVVKAMIEYHETEVKKLSKADVSNSIATEYAEFCVRCDRDKLPLLCLEDYIKQYCC